MNVMALKRSTTFKPRIIFIPPHPDSEHHGVLLLLDLHSGACLPTEARKSQPYYHAGNQWFQEESPSLHSMHSFNTFPPLCSSKFRLRRSNEARLLCSFIIINMDARDHKYFCMWRFAVRQALNSSGALHLAIPSVD
jgi:hypothetical protein